MNSVDRIDVALAKFTDACTQDIHLRRKPRHLTFVIAGRFNDAPHHPQLDRWTPFLCVVSNSIGEQGRQLDPPRSAFQACSTRLLRKTQHITVCRGDLRPSVHSEENLRSLYRYLRRDLSPGAKIAVCAHYIQNVAIRSKRVGGHIMGAAILSSEQFTGFDVPPEGRHSQQTVPHLVTESGLAVINVKFTNLE
jgi:hypothetical protein